MIINFPINLKMNFIPILVAVYGTLRQYDTVTMEYSPERNAHYLEDSEFIGMTSSMPLFYMRDLEGYPGIFLNGGGHIVMEVYEVTSARINQALDDLEGFVKEGYKENIYDKIPIWTEFGEAMTYVINEKSSVYQKAIPEIQKGRFPIIISGDWKYKEFYQKEPNRSFIERVLQKNM